MLLLTKGGMPAEHIDASSQKSLSFHMTLNMDMNMNIQSAKYYYMGWYSIQISYGMNFNDNGQRGHKYKEG